MENPFLRTLDPKTLTVEEAILIAKKECGNKHCRQYLLIIPDSLSLKEINPQAEYVLKIQLSHALSNMKNWHGERANVVKEVLRKYTGIDK